MENLTPPLFVMGGFAEDALLHHCLTRQRKDLDLLVEREGLHLCIRQLESLGVASLEVDLADSVGNPLCLRSQPPAPAVDVWVCKRQVNARYSLELPGELPGKPSDSGRFRLLLPPDTFEMPPTDIDGISIHVVSPLALYLLRETSARTRSKADGGTRDREICAALKQAFLGRYRQEQLEPQLASL